MMGWLYKRKHVTFDKFDTKNDRELQKIAKEVDSTAIRRQTFESDEYEEFILKMRTYVSKKQATVEKLTEQQYADRQLVREYFLFISNTGLRTREARLLRWEDVTRIDEKLTEIHVRKETSKWGKSRDLTERVWHILERWAKVSKELYGRTAEGIIFSRDGKTEFDRGQFNTHFNAIKGMMENLDERKRQSLVPYSFRHWYITKKYTAGVPLQALTKVCGTSMEWIEKTYSHLNKELQLNVALAGNKRNKDGTLEVKILSR